MSIKKTPLRSRNITKPLDPARHFSVPDGYFEGLADRVKQRIETIEQVEERLSHRDRSERRRSRKSLYIAVASVVAVLLAIPLIYTTGIMKIQDEETTLSGRSNDLERYEQYSDQDYEDYLSEDLADDYYLHVTYSGL